MDSRVSGITEERGGRRKQYFEITRAGVLALNEVRAMRKELFDRLPANKVEWLDI